MSTESETKNANTSQRHSILHSVFDFFSSFEYVEKKGAVPKSKVRPQSKQSCTAKKKNGSPLTRSKTGPSTYSLQQSQLRARATEGSQPRAYLPSRSYSQRPQERTKNPLQTQTRGGEKNLVPQTKIFGRVASNRKNDYEPTHPPQTWTVSFTVGTLSNWNLCREWHKSDSQRERCFRPNENKTFKKANNSWTYICTQWSDKWDEDSGQTFRVELFDLISFWGFQKWNVLGTHPKQGWTTFTIKFYHRSVKLNLSPLVHPSLLKPVTKLSGPNTQKKAHFFWKSRQRWLILY